MEPTKYFNEDSIKSFRVEIDRLIQLFGQEQEIGATGITNKDDDLYLISEHQVLVHLIDAKMWLGKMLEARGTPFPANLADKADLNSNQNISKCETNNN